MLGWDLEIQSLQCPPVVADGFVVGEKGKGSVGRTGTVLHGGGGLTGKGRLEKVVRQLGQVGVQVTGPQLDKRLSHQLMQRLAPADRELIVKGLSDKRVDETMAARGPACQEGPGLIRLRGLHRDPLLVPARVDLSGMAPESLDSWWLGWAEDSTPVFVRLAEVSGIVVAGLAGFGKTMLVGHLLGQLAPSPAVQFVLIDGKGGPDYDRLFPRAWLSAKDDLDQVRDVLRRVHRLMVDRQASIAQVLGVTDAWHLGPSPSWPLVVVVIDEAHTFFHERKGTSPEVKAHNAVVAELSRLVEELIRKGRNVAIQVMLLTQRATGDAIPTRIRDNCQVAISFATRTVDGAVAALGEEIRHHPDASPVRLNDPVYVGVAVTSLPGRPGFQRVRTPQVDHHHVAAVIRVTTGLRADPAALLAAQAPGLRVVPQMPAPGDAA
jgi:S-DNA-T family DNA segregation ATPase FtsK/SpoIIIE